MARPNTNPAKATPSGGVLHASHVQMQMRAGPLPDPADLRAYEDIVPGLAGIIVEKFAAQSDHRRELEALVIRGNERRANRGQWIAAAIAFAAIGAGFALAWNGKQTAGMATIITALGSLVLVFLGGKLLQGKDAGQRRE